MGVNDFGPLAQVVAYAGYMTAAALAIRVAWAGKLIWEPNIRDLAKAPARVAGVLSAVTIVLLFAYSRSTDEWRWLAPYAIVFTGIGLSSLLGYIFLLAGFTIQCPGDAERVVAGFWRTPTANRILSGKKTKHLFDNQPPPGSVRDLFCGSGKDPDRIWEPQAQALTKVCLVAIYIAFVSSTTLSIATGAIILEKSSPSSQSAEGPTRKAH